MPKIIFQDGWNRAGGLQAYSNDNPERFENGYYTREEPVRLVFRPYPWESAARWQLERLHRERLGGQTARPCLTRISHLTDVPCEDYAIDEGNAD